MFKLMASQSSSNVFSKTGFKFLTPSMDQVGLYEDWKVHAHPVVPSQIGSAWLLGRGEGPGWGTEEKDSCSKKDQATQNCIIWKMLGKQCWRMGLTDGGAGVLPGLQPIKV